MVNCRLYLPREWTSDKKRCKKAGIPKAEQVYRAKPELALEMIREMEGEISYNWVGGDTIYGNSPTLRHGLQKLKRLFVMDTSEEQLVYLQPPPALCPYFQARKGP